jgi:DNA-binding XRE family transcriptional regulator
MGRTAFAQARGLPDAEHYRHGTRARYVSGCRCAECTAGNTRSYHERMARARAAVADLPAAPLKPAPQAYTTRGGKPAMRTYRRACPGINGRPCPKGRHLRKDSAPLCWGCRDEFAYRGLVDAEPIRKHLRQLARLGVGQKSVAEACDVGRTTIVKIKKGQSRIRAELARRILAVTKSAIADSALVPAGPTWELLKDLLQRGWTKTALARGLGSKGPSPTLQIRRTQVEAATALAVEKFHRNAGDPPPRRSRWGVYPARQRLPDEACSCEKPLRLRDVYAKCEKRIIPRRRA